MKAYLIIDLHITDPHAFSRYANGIPALIEKYAGRYLVKGVEAELIEGNAKPGRSVVIEFPSIERARDFLRERQSSDLYPIWERSTRGTILLAEGSVD